MITDAWIKEASEEIYVEHYRSEDIEEIIRKHCPFKQNEAYVHLSEVRLLASLLVESKREHLHVDDDSWYCCGKCQHPDHGLDGEWLCTHRSRNAGVCNCGADRWNQRVDEVVKDYRVSPDMSIG